MLLDVKIIKTEKDLNQYLKRIDEIIDAPKGSPEREELGIISILVNAYEEKNHPIELPDPIAAIKSRMEDLELNGKDLEGIIGDKSIVSLVLNKKRSLTKEMIRALNIKLNIPFEVLIQDYELISEVGTNKRKSLIGLSSILIAGKQNNKRSDIREKSLSELLHPAKVVLPKKKPKKKVVPKITKREITRSDFKGRKKNG